MILSSAFESSARGALSHGFQDKTGVGVRVTMERVTCPAACPMRGRECYAETGTVSWHWNKVDRGERGLPWPQLVGAIAAMPLGAWWRWAQAGDLPAGGHNRIDGVRALELARAAKGRPAVAYTHYPVTDGTRESLWNAATLRQMAREGFHVNASCETLSQVDRAMNMGIPAVVVQPEDSPDTLVTEQGRRGVFCPAQRDGGKTTCFGGKGTRACGGGTPLCGRGDREWFVIFKVHGVRKNQLNERFATGQLAKAA
jgi:hypothetical protein